MRDFRDSFGIFLIEFQDKFYEFFSSQCSNYDYALDREETKRAAKEVLANLFVEKVELSTDVNDTILQMKKDGVSIGFLLNKSLLYMLENFIEFLKKDDGYSLEYCEILIQEYSRFSHQFENYISYNVDNYNMMVGFGDSNYIYSKNNIIDIFHKMKEENVTIEFMNLYQGYPIRSYGKIIDIDSEEVVFEIENDLQEIAMKLEGKAYIVKNQYFHRHIKADISYSNFSNNTIVLNNFIYLLNLPAVQRKYPRIYPRILIHATLLGDNNVQIIGNLYDLSQSGIGMISEENMGFYNGAKVSIEFDVEYLGGTHHIKTSGEIVDIMLYMRSYRYCLKIFPDSENMEKIVKYIERREEEIIQELRDELSSYIF